MKKRVLLIHPVVRPSGGGQSVAAWTLEALKDVCDLSLLTWAPVQYEGVNRFFGTSLKPGDFRVYRSPLLLSRFIDALPTPVNLLQMSLLQRYCRRLDHRHRFDLLISTNNEMDFGRPGVQYVHYPWAYLPRPENDWRWYHSRGLVQLYRALCWRYSLGSLEGLRSNLTLANSPFISEKIQAAHAIQPLVLPPPVPGGFPEVPWDRRKDAFIALGRLSPEKRWDHAAEIIRRVRAAGREVSLTFIVTCDQRSSLHQMQEMAKRNPKWITVHFNIPRNDMVRLMAQHRYALHPMENEHFGIAVAEQQRAGCLPFVHRSGGPAHIVGNDAHLTFDTTDEAVGKILAVIDSKATQDDLRRRAAQRSKLYTSETFVHQIRQIVENFEQERQKLQTA